LKTPATPLTRRVREGPNMGPARHGVAGFFRARAASHSVSQKVPQFRAKVASSKFLNFEAEPFVRNFNKLTVAKFSCKSAAVVRCRAGITFPSFRGNFARTKSIGAKLGKQLACKLLSPREHFFRRFAKISRKCHRGSFVRDPLKQ